MIDYQAIGKRIRECRKKRKLTQTGLGGATGLSSSFIGHVERGTRKASLTTMLHIAEALDTSLDLLLTGRMKIEEERLSLVCKKQMLHDITRILNEHADEWMPSLELRHGDY